MSTYWNFVCLAHDPPLYSDEEFTQHTDDSAFRHALELAAQRPVERSVAGWEQYFDRNARNFLFAHPTCPLAIESEYGERRELPALNKNSEEQSAEDLQGFFQDRTLGFTSWGEWSWRGSGYDDGWIPMTQEEKSRLRDLLRTTWIPGISTSEGEQ